MPEVSSDSDDDADSDDDKDVDDEPPDNAGVDPVEHTRVPMTAGEDTEEDDDTAMDQKYGPQTHGTSRRDRKPRNYDHQYKPGSFDHTMSQFEEPIGEVFQT
jgi:hypothetical protein